MLFVQFPPSSRFQRLITSGPHSRASSADCLGILIKRSSFVPRAPCVFCASFSACSAASAPIFVVVVIQSTWSRSFNKWWQQFILENSLRRQYWKAALGIDFQVWAPPEQVQQACAGWHPRGTQAILLPSYITGHQMHILLSEQARSVFAVETKVFLEAPRE